MFYSWFLLLWIGFRVSSHNLTCKNCPGFVYFAYGFTSHSIQEFGSKSIVWIPEKCLYFVFLTCTNFFGGITREHLRLSCTCRQVSDFILWMKWNYFRPQLLYSVSVNSPPFYFACVHACICVREWVTVLLIQLYVIDRKTGSGSSGQEPWAVYWSTLSSWFLSE